MKDVYDLVIIGGDAAGLIAIPFALRFARCALLQC
jgi:hypothetical protein